MGMEKGEGSYGSRTVEDLMRDKGEMVVKGILSEADGERWIEITKDDGTVEYIRETDLNKET
jgi:hypothetical protein